MNNSSSVEKTPFSVPRGYKLKLMLVPDDTINHVTQNNLAGNDATYNLGTARPSAEEAPCISCGVYPQPTAASTPNVLEPPRCSTTSIPRETSPTVRFAPRESISAPVSYGRDPQRSSVNTFEHKLSINQVMNLIPEYHGDPEGLAKFESAVRSVALKIGPSDESLVISAVSPKLRGKALSAFNANGLNESSIEGFLKDLNTMFGDIGRYS